MRVVVTGATGTIGRVVVAQLLERGDEVVALSRDVQRGREALPDEVEVVLWREPASQPAPAEAFDDAAGVINLLGEPLAQRWSESAKRAICDSRVAGTHNLVEGMRSAGPRLRTLVSQSATGYYGAHGDERVDESTPAGTDFLASVVTEWETAAETADDLGLRVVTCRTGVVLSPSGGALEKMLPPFRLGVGGPVAGGRQYVPWVHVDDAAGALLFCLDNEDVDGPVNVTAPEPATNRELSKALGRTLRRPAAMPVPAFALKLLYGEMSTTVLTGVRAVPVRLEQLGYEFQHRELEEALRAILRPV